MHYIASREWFREKGTLPILLVVVPSKEQKRRIANIVAFLQADIPGLLIRITTATRLVNLGPLSSIWYQILPINEAAEIMPRCRFYDLESDT